MKSEAASRVRELSCELNFPNRLSDKTQKPSSSVTMNTEYRRGEGKRGIPIPGSRLPHLLLDDREI